MKKREILVREIFIVMTFIGLLFVPSGMCNDNALEEWIQPDASNAEVITTPLISSDNAIKEIEEWIQNHTVKVTLTTTCKYDGENLLINEVYTGKELEERFEVEQLTKEFKIPVESQVIRMQKGEEKILVTEKVKLITPWNDPLPWWDDYDYPQWTWSLYLDPLIPIPTVWAISADPINLAWENTNIDRVKDEILEDPDWITISSPFQQHAHYVYDPDDDDWVVGDGVANDAWGLFGRYHARLWQMSDGVVVANAHHDCPPITIPFGHEADQYEEAERLITSFFILGHDDKEWTCCVDSYDLNNNVDDPFSNGKCTQIFYGLGLDLIFVIDTTGSMYDDIANVKASASAIVNEIEASIPNYRVAVVDYRDFPVNPYGGAGDYPFNDVIPFSTDKAAIISAIQSLTLGWGKDWRESVYSALMHSSDAISLGGWRGEDQAMKVIILLGDAPPHDPEPFTGYTLNTVTTAAELADPVHIYTIQIGGTVENFAELASQTGGEVFTAENAEEVVDVILEAIEEITERPVADANGPYAGVIEYIAVPITFDGTGSYDPDGTIRKYEWDLDNDGKFDDAFGAMPTVSFTAPYSGNIHLKVTDDNGATDTDTTTLTITKHSPPPNGIHGGLLTPPEQPQCYSGTSTIQGKGYFTIDERIQDWATAIDTSEHIEGTGEFEMDSKKVLNQAANTSDFYDPNFHYKKTMLFQGNATNRLISRDKFESSGIFGGTGTRINEYFDVSMIQKDESGSIKTIAAPGSGQSHRFATMDDFSGIWGIHSDWQKICQKEITHHQMFAGNFSVQKDLTFEREVVIP